MVSFAQRDASLNVLRVRRCAAVSFFLSGFRGARLTKVFPPTFLKTRCLPTIPRRPVVMSLSDTFAMLFFDEVSRQNNVNILSVNLLQKFYRSIFRVYDI
jgi:hypothetical protein